jgi:hypothetical protein
VESAAATVFAGGGGKETSREAEVTELYVQDAGAQ